MNMNALGWQEWAFLIALLVGVALAVQSLLLLRSARRKKQAQLHTLPDDLVVPPVINNAPPKRAAVPNARETEQEEEVLRLSIELRELREQQRETRQQVRQLEQQLQAMREPVQRLMQEWQAWQVAQQTAPVLAPSRVSVQAAVSNPLPTSPYNQAVELAKQGYDAAALASNCGISRGEADLIVALYRTQSGHNH